MTERTGPWRCFFCDELLTTQHEAEMHFGKSEESDPSCKLTIGGEWHFIDAVRRMEDELHRYRREDSIIIRASLAQASDHGQALRREEEKGFERGVRDMRKMYQTLLDELHTHFGCDPECEKRHLHVITERIASNGT